jgi:threonine dehydrogenase-like Zn-dependent dehydrogenase
MQQLTFVARGRVEFREVAEPALDSEEGAIVRPIASTTCDLDRAIIAGRTPFEGPFAIGHECVAEVVEAGSHSGVEPGVSVVVPWHPCCTECPTCRRGLTAHCERVRRFAMYGLPLGGDLGGLFDDLVYVPFGRALVPLPNGVRAESVASASDNLTDAYGAVARSLHGRPGLSVLVLGGTGSIGQWAAGWAVALGADRVVYADDDAEGSRTAATYGAATIADLSELTSDEPFDVLIDASGHAKLLAEAIAHVGPGGHCHSVGIYFAERTGLPLGAMYMNAISFTTGRPSVAPLLPEVLRAVAEGRLDPAPVFSERLRYDQAPEALAEIPRKALFTRA